MELAQLVDFEVQLHRDEASVRAGGEPDLRARDARIGAQITAEFGSTATEAAAQVHADREFRARVATAWLRQMEAEDRSGRDHTARALRRAALILTLALLVVGALTARGALAYDGKEPVNVFVFLGLLVVPQIALLVLLAWATLRGGRGMLGGAITALSQVRLLGGSSTATLGAVGARLSLHAGVERWFTFALAQRAAVAFNVGALATCLALVSLTDLAFCWSTTLQLAAEHVHTACRGIAAPWSWFAPDAVPSASLVRDSQWVRMPGSFVAGGSLPDAVATSGRWWSFLVIALATWGLLPRGLALGLAAWQSRRAQRAVPFDDPRCHALFARLWPATPSWQGPSPSTISLPESERAKAHANSTPPAAVASGATWLLCWGHLARAREGLAQRVTRATGAPPLGVLAVGGANLADDDDAVRRLANAKADRVLLALAAGSQPTKDVLDLLRVLRQRLGPRARLSVALATDDATTQLANEELAGWRACLDRQADPYLALERLEAHA